MRARAAREEFEGFPIHAGVHQGSTLSQLRFILTMEEATKKFTGEMFWQLPYTDDLVPSVESMEEVD